MNAQKFFLYLTMRNNDSKMRSEKTEEINASKPYLLLKIFN